MQKAFFAFLILGLLLPIPLAGQEVFVGGNSQGVADAKADLGKYTHYRLSADANNATLLVDEISWSPDFLSPATTAIRMQLLTPWGGLLWSETEPVDSRPKAAVIQDLLKELARAKPSLSGTKEPSAETGEHKPRG